MKSKNWSQSIVALVVIGCSLLLLAALTFAISGLHFGKKGRTLEIEFKDATGVKLHSTVRYAGAHAGSVVAIRYLTPAERAEPGKRDFAVRVTIRLEDDVPPLASDTKASISSETILGEKFVALSVGSPDAKPLPDGSIIQGQSMSGIESMTQSLEKTAAAATDLLQKFSSDYPELLTNLTRLLLSGETLLSTTTNLVTDAQGAIADVRNTLKQVDQTVAGVGPGASNFLVQATSATTNLNRTFDNTHAITAELQMFLTNQFLTNLDQSMKNLTSVLARTEITLEYAKILAARLAEKPSRLIWQMKTNPVPTEDEIRRGLPASTLPENQK